MLTMRKELRFILLSILFSIWETLRNTRSSSFSLSTEASSMAAGACTQERARTGKRGYTVYT